MMQSIQTVIIKPQHGKVHCSKLAMVVPTALREGPVAGSYYTCDFSWDELRVRAEPIVRQHEAFGKSATGVNLQHAHSDSAHLQSHGQCSMVHGHVTLTVPVEEGSSSGSSLVQDVIDVAVVGSSNSAGASKKDKAHKGPGSLYPGPKRKPASKHRGSSGVVSLVQTDQPPLPTPEGGEDWDRFYASTARSALFYKERRYILLEFPCLSQQKPLHVVELGCGYGASLMPVLKTNPHCRVTATDISPTCVGQLREVASREGITDISTRIASFVADSADAASQPLFVGLDADVALIMFTLSAVDPKGQATMLSNAYTALQPGGLLCIRDHGLYDMVQLRIPAEQWLGPNLYKRGDGTLAYFFSVEDLREKAEAAGFEVSECNYVTVYNTNRKTGLRLERVFVHGLFRRPLTDGSGLQPTSTSCATSPDHCGSS